jgi:ArsR family metal-binding transcriptional regulator
MLIDTYDLDVFTPPCDPGAVRYGAVAHLHTDVSEALPYLNATLRGAVYNQAAPALSWRKAGHYVVFHADRIAVSNVEDRDSAIHEMETLVKLLNHTWDKRDQITPDTTAHERPTAMSLYKLLPNTNCKLCGDATCWNFALKLAAAQVKLDACPPLQEPAYAAQLAALQALVIPAPAII